MQSQSVKRVVSGVLAASAVFAAVSFVQSPATAAPAPQAPPPASTSDALAKYRDLSTQAEKINEEFLKAQDDLNARQGDLDKAGQELEAAKATGTKAAEDEGKYRVDVDKFAGASFSSGIQLNKLSALLAGNSTQDFLQRSSALDILATERNQALGGLTSAVDKANQAAKAASDAQGKAQSARDAAAKLKDDVAAKKKSLDDQKNELATQAGKLSAADKALQKDKGGTPPDVKAPGPAAQTAVNAALSKLGSNYVYGATGPNTFDCSGLTGWAYDKAGISIPRTSGAQSQFGAAVSRSALQPGDLVFYGSPVHHVGMYIGDGKMVHAPDTGDVVKISPLQNDYAGARRPS
ncbi:C40 family peptidase [Amycolatopsis sp. H20-H5]|uniref:C40 family peptidase n=1 Tax=Amycolatopsis sp. H20-H5 TaxID=3046309 RepID=UPI002DB7A327|nr:NlpC/P60 family protein [Amycolatopsis sp. H20-H5]MEC3975430.1 NlpC/P60 family protein [Amycolatopsis sp. H20-H5]